MFCLFIFAFLPLVFSFSILEFGAIPNNSSTEASVINSHAIQLAIAKANSSAIDRVVLVPAGLNFYIFNLAFVSVRNLTFQVDGNLTVSNDIAYWEDVIVDYNTAVIYVSESQYFYFQGNGMIDGQGYDWWWYVVLGGEDNRPFLVLFNQVKNAEIRNIRAKNSPFWHFNLYDVANIYVNGVYVHVDVYAQQDLLRKYGFLDETTVPGQPIPMFPLNTDGFDPAGSNITIENCIIENFDDAIAVKPLTKANILATCSENMYFRNITVILGVGLTIGSVPPHQDVNCVKNITFEDCHSIAPFKGIYIKTNPGTNGSGIIDSITYKNVFINGSTWYPIWIGPQQQHQPHETGEGCSFVYPLIPVCPTQPLVPISNVVLSNVTLINGWLWPGVILCDPLTPCKGFVFDQVINTPFNDTFKELQDYVCENVYGSHSSTSPNPGCF